MQLHPDRKMEAWLRIYLTMGFITSLFFSFILYYILGMATSATIFIAFSVIYVMFFFVLIPKYCDSCTVEVKRERLRVKRGFVFPRIYILPARNIQYIRISAGIFERILGICTAYVATGGKGVRIYALNPKTARNIRLEYERGEEK